MLSLLDHEFSLRQTSLEGDPARSEIILRGASTGHPIHGVVLEAAIGWGDFYLLFTTDDIPFEEYLSMSFFDQHLNLLDFAELGCIYSTGMFEQLSLAEPNIVNFRFIGDTDWRIELSDAPFFAWPFLSDPRGISRKWGFYRYFRIYGNPKPDV